MARFHLAFWFVVVVKVICPAALADPSVVSEHRFVATIAHEIQLGYLLSMPESLELDTPEAGARYPLVIFLHGAGERGDDLAKLEAHGPPKLLASGEAPEVLRKAFVLSPQCPAERFWSSEIMVEALDQLLAEVLDAHPIDRSRIYLTGLSMGGYGTWAWGGGRTDTFAALAPVCGGGMGWSAHNIGEAKVPIWAFHGDRDGVVPLAETIDLMDVVREAGHDGPDARLTVYSNTTHNSWTAAYGDAAFWDWLFRQRRSGEPGFTQ
ncbi:MAG: dienelactone hydrolase family protein [Planctomycetota bacterium]